MKPVVFSTFEAKPSRIPCQFVSAQPQRSPRLCGAALLRQPNRRVAENAEVARRELKHESLNSSLLQLRETPLTVVFRSGNQVDRADRVLPTANLSAANLPQLQTSLNVA